MAITYYKVDQYSVDWQCDKCKVGYMRPYNQVIKVHKTGIPHKCNSKDCGHTQTFPTAYPMQLVVPEGDEVNFISGKEPESDA